MDVSVFNETFIEKTVSQGAMQAGCQTAGTYAVHLETAPEARFLLGRMFNVSYSTFFRNPLTFAVIDKMVLPGILARKAAGTRKSVRIWSAACAGGQEAYSMAILLESCFFDRQYFDYQIFGTDHDAEQILAAKMAIYRSESLENVPLKYLSKWFIADNDQYALHADLKQHVVFSVFDLLNPTLSSPPESIFGTFDIVFCANLLFYYKPAIRLAILEKIQGALASDGLVITGESERQIMKDARFREVFPQSAVFRSPYSKP